MTSIEKLTRTIYSIAWPETQQALAKMKTLDIAPMFQETWSKKQDAIHIPYMNKWKSVFKKYISFNEETLKFGYPTNGSSESINMILANLKTKGYELVVFNEEYEGYSMVAKNMAIPVHSVSRKNYEQEIVALQNKVKAPLVMFLSQPSSIDGMYWQGFQQYMDFMETTSVRVYVDVTYAGCFEHQTIILDNYNCLDGVIYSLSKCFGVYYHRIGGCFLREENPLLWPMLWFKNLMSIQYAILLLDSFERGQYNDTRVAVKEFQKQIADKLSAEIGLKVIPSDVPMIVMIEADFEKAAWLKQYDRGENKEYVRVCISQLIEQLLRK